MQQTLRTKLLLVTGVALLSAAALPARADNAMQSIDSVTVDVQKLSSGYRSSRLIGSAVVNDGNETIGKIDDLIVSPDDNKTTYVIISCGGWLGMGSHLVALPYDTLRITKAKITLPGATREGLKSMPEFKYNVT